MADPYQVLGVSPDADEDAVRGRYLQLVRENPPERAPERFAEIRAAYEQVSDPIQAWSTRLFDAKQHETMDDLVARYASIVQIKRLPTELLFSLGEK